MHSLEARNRPEASVTLPQMLNALVAAVERPAQRDQDCRCTGDSRWWRGCVKLECVLLRSPATICMLTKNGVRNERFRAFFSGLFEAFPQ
jgi:hypothetical protein